MDDDRTQCDRRYNWLKHQRQIVLLHLRQISGTGQLMQCEHRHKNSPDTHQTEMTRKQGFFPVPNLWDPFMQHEHSGNPPDEQDCNAQSRQSPRCDPQFVTSLR